MRPAYGMTLRALAQILVAGLLIAAMTAAPGGCGQTPCTPEEHGLAGATRLTLRQLPGRAATPDVPCTRPRIEVVSSDEELRRLYDELASPDGGAPASGAVEYPAVDFTRERVIVREGPSTQGISWAVAQGETGFIGLLSCGGVQNTGCVVNVVAVPALITRAESRTCDPVGCGNPMPAPPRARP